MRVLYVHKDFDPRAGGGGTARHIYGLATTIAKLGCEARVIAPSPAPFKEPFLTITSDGSDFAKHIEWADVVHVHGARSGFAFSAARAASKAGRPFFYTPHCWYDPKSVANAVVKAIWDQTAERFLLGRSAGTFILTEEWREWVVKRRLPTDRLIVVPNCVLAGDLPKIDCHAGVEHLSGSPAILSVGRLSAEKRGSDIIKALAEPALAAAELHIVGRGDDQAAMAAVAEKLGVQDRVHFYGFVSDDGVSKMIAGGDVFAFASSQEGLPTILLEMIVARIPTVSTRIPGNLAITDAAGMQSTYEVGDIPRLAALLAEPASIPISDGMVASVMQHFTWEARAPEILAAYQRATQSDRSRLTPA
jgi:glycosyltransferase involved in cell wall biosynthesis